ncbi:DUF4258 domain-containing protein [Trueperella abortisuis]|uniref:DUF4258 domain-containing protein n=1 Tax=Trueperella abortisuis TaxID=445930 RepID=UPI00389A866E
MRNIYFKILAFSLVYTLLPFSPALYESLGKGYAAQHSETSKLVTLIADDDPSLAPAFPDNAPSILPQACISRMCMEHGGGNVSIAGFALSRHAIARMSERNVSTSQVRTALVSGKRYSCCYHWQDRQDCHDWSPEFGMDVDRLEVRLL